MTDEQKIQRLTDVIVSLQEEINLHTRARVVEERSEEKAKAAWLREERDTAVKEAEKRKKAFEFREVKIHVVLVQAGVSRFKREKIEAALGISVKP